MVIDGPDGQPQRRCTYSSDWLFCIRTIHMAQQELALLILPTTDRSLISWRVGAVLVIGILVATALALYLWMAQRQTDQVQTKNQELAHLLTKLQQTQAQLVQTEKMSSLGQMVAGIAHEINNPVNFVHGNLKYAQEYSDDLLALVKLYQIYYPDPVPAIQEQLDDLDVAFITKDLPRLMESMRVGAERIRQIVLSLRNFSRLDEKGVKGVDIHEGIESTLMILNNRLQGGFKHQAITVIKDYGKLPLVECYPGQLNQVFMNILANAIDALEENPSLDQQLLPPPSIHIETHHLDDRWIAIEIADNGPGIPEDLKSRLIDPFFTTKQVGKGTGLGLFISYQIVTEKHGGELSWRSQPGQETKFEIKLPISLETKVKTN
jgi:signal transduction histidine kinase